jgi:uncharacterized DUF497 family protein
MRYAWDDDKAASNEVKHGITFERAVEVFDLLGAEIPDLRKNYGEDRINRYGRLKDGTTVCVTYTLREDGQVRRIISARPAKREERPIIP